MTGPSPPPSAPPPADATPTAVVRPPRRLSLAWLVPIAALAMAGWLGYRAWVERGVRITVQLEDGHGLKAGHEIRYRGITVGQVREVQLADDLAGVVVVGSLQSQGRLIARAGSRFWVVRPQLGLDRIGGLETVVGPRYLAVLPGEGPRQTRFVGVGEPPPVESVEPGDLEVIVQARSRGGLRVGAPVLYREVQVGAVLSAGLTSDAGAVEARVHIEKAYAELIRPETRFWRVGGVRARVGLRGLDLQLDSLQSLLVGGIALSTPPDGGPVVRTGHRFLLSEEPEDDWLRWEPMVVVGSELLPPGAAAPTPLRATLGWREGWLFKGQQSRQGWVLPTDQGLLGPADLLRPDADAEEGTVVLEVAGTVVAPGAQVLWNHGGLAMVHAELGQHPWPMSRARAAEEPEDCLVMADPGAAPYPLAAARMTAGGDIWSVDPAVALDAGWHGACVLARSDGRLIGLLLIGEKGQVNVGLLGGS